MSEKQNAQRQPRINLPMLMLWERFSRWVRTLCYLRPNKFDWLNGAGRQTCKYCGRPSGFDFGLPDWLWVKIVPKRYRHKVLCLACFDRFAARKNIEWLRFLKHLLFVGEVECFDFPIEALGSLWIRSLRVKEIRYMIVEQHADCIAPYMGGRGGFGETFCGHIHELGMTFRELAEHFEISMSELADVTADHIRRL